MNNNNNNQDDDGQFYVCPSFNAYSSDHLAQTALRVAVENSTNSNDDDEEDFEFALVSDGKEVVSADEFLQIGQIFPVFNRDLQLVSAGGELNPIEEEIAVPLSKLFIEEDNNNNNNNNERFYNPDPSSCSSSEAADDDLDHIPAGTYCVWRPKLLSESPAPNQCKKSKSTGSSSSSSRRWRLRDLLRRCNSDGKDSSFVFLTPKQKSSPPTAASKLIQSSKSKSPVTASPSAHETFYVQNRAMKQGERKRSYLPYRQDLVGFFGNVNALRRSFPHL